MTRPQKDAVVEVADEFEVRAKVFRLLTRDGTGACTRSLWCRFDYGENGWQVSFYDKFGEKDATQGADPLTAIPEHLADLALEALRRLIVLRENSDNRPSFPV